MKLVLVVYRIDEDEYHILSNKSSEEIEDWVRRGYLVLGGTYDILPSGETILDSPSSVSVLE